MYTKCPTSGKRTSVLRETQKEQLLWTSYWANAEVGWPGGRFASVFFDGVPRETRFFLDFSLRVSAIEKTPPKIRQFDPCPGFWELTFIMHTARPRLLSNITKTSGKQGPEDMVGLLRTPRTHTRVPSTLLASLYYYVIKQGTREYGSTSSIIILD